MDVATIKKDLENQLGVINKELENIYIPHDAVLIFLRKRTAFETALKLLDSLQQEQPDFPTTDEEIERLLATHPKVEVPQKYKTPDWLWKKQEQPEVDLEKEVEKYLLDNVDFITKSTSNEMVNALARHFYELGLNARKEDK